MRIDPPDPFLHKMCFNAVEAGDVFLFTDGKYYLKIKGSFRTAVCLLDGIVDEFGGETLVEVVDCFLKIDRR